MQHTAGELCCRMLYHRLKVAESRSRVCFPRTWQRSIRKVTTVLNSSPVMLILLCTSQHCHVHLILHSEQRKCAKGNRNHLSDLIVAKYLSWDSMSIVGCLSSMSEFLGLIPSIWQASKTEGISHVFVCLLPILFLHILFNYFFIFEIIMYF